ncbi:hypothetical protein C8Q79DRAFT_757725 [Trametes meyenii]|nr:hypothetical protein C8Q79DRAFT_757725 [Trametes meyenii]
MASWLPLLVPLLVPILSHVLPDLFLPRSTEFNLDHEELLRRRDEDPSQIMDIPHSFELVSEPDEITEPHSGNPGPTTTPVLPHVSSTYQDPTPNANDSPIISIDQTANVAVKKDGESIYDASCTEQEIFLRKIHHALVHITSENFLFTADRVGCLVNHFEGRGGRPLSILANHILLLASQHPHLGNVLARLSRHLVEQISTDLYDGDSTDVYGNTLQGGPLFRQRLVDSCGFAFHLRLVGHGLIALQDDDESGEEHCTGSSLYHHAVENIKSDGPGLATFLAELYNMNILPRRVIHGCLDDLLRDPMPAVVQTGVVEDLKALLTISGELLDATDDGRARVDGYISHIKHLIRTIRCGWRNKSMLEVRYSTYELGSLAVSSSSAVGRLPGRYSLQEVIALREQGWSKMPKTPDAEPWPQHAAFAGMQWRRKTHYADTTPPMWRASNPDRSAPTIETNERIEGARGAAATAQAPRTWANSRLRKASVPTIGDESVL